MPEGHECTEKSLEYFKMYEHMTHAKALYQKKRRSKLSESGGKMGPMQRIRKQNDFEVLNSNLMTME